MSVASREIDNAVVNVAEIDYLDLWAVARLLEARFADELGADAIEVALDSVERLVTDGVLRAGDLVPPGEFEAWPEQGGVAIRVIRERADALQTALNVGDVGWFELVG